MIIITSIYNLIKSVFEYLIKIISTIMVFFGVYIPFFYMVFGLALKLFLKLELFNIHSANSQLFILGLSLSILASVIITVRKLILYPIAVINEKFEFKEHKKEIKRQAQNAKNHKSFNNRQNNERPLVYRSTKFPDIIVYEYNDCFDLYKEIDGRLEIFKTEYKKHYEYEN